MAESNMGLEQCPSCKGYKKIPRMGMMGEDICKTCNGVGWIEKNPPKEEPVIIVKKRGRKPKIQV